MSDQSIVSMSFREQHKRGRQKGSKNRCGPSTLTSRELDVLKLMIIGKSNIDIATILELSPLTIKNHVHNILYRLSAENRTAVLFNALRLGIIEPPPVDPNLFRAAPPAPKEPERLVVLPGVTPERPAFQPADGVALYESGRVFINNLEVLPRFGRTQFDLLRYFLENPGRVHTREHLLNRVWGINRAVEERSVDVQIRHLRVKLEPLDFPYEFNTVRSIGYQLVKKHAT